jgi:hypothetical protein
MRAHNAESRGRATVWCVRIVKHYRENLKWNHLAQCTIIIIIPRIACYKLVMQGCVENVV